MDCQFENSHETIKQNLEACDNKQEIIGLEYKNNKNSSNKYSSIKNDLKSNTTLKNSNRNLKINFNKYLVNTKSFADDIKTHQEENLLLKNNHGNIHFSNDNVVVYPTFEDSGQKFITNNYNNYVSKDFNFSPIDYTINGDDKIKSHSGDYSKTGRLSNFDYDLKKKNSNKTINISRHRNDTNITKTRLFERNNNEIYFSKRK